MKTIKETIEENTKIVCVDNSISSEVKKELVERGAVVEERPDMEDLYRLYDFSDKVQLLVDDGSFPGILNYVKTGVITEEEMIKAILYK